jgi:hypothetical protein
MKQKNYIFILILLSTILVSCTEEFVIETQTFESALVVEATITDEFKQQEIKLSRTYALEQDEQIFENNATVQVVNDLGTTYSFIQSNGGSYLSTIEFNAEPDRTYTLEITTNDGKQYISNPSILPATSQIDDLYTELINGESTGLGIQVFLNNNNENNSSQYFRYEYEETYKIVAPYHSDYKAVLTNFVLASNGDSVFFDTEFVIRPQEEEICFISKKSTEIIQTTTSNLDNNIIQRLPIRFITTNSGIIRDRYSILVKQYSQSIEAFSYYKTLSLFGNNESILSENQPGYIQSNITNLNTNERVVGFFEVSSVSNKRTYFNYNDFNLVQPNYLYECDVIELDYNINATCGQCDPPIRNERSEIYRLLTSFEEFNSNYSIVEVPPVIEGVWTIVSPECGDCTTVGSNIQPDFWED